jgi:SAM-dependent methyltransferase
MCQAVMTGRQPTPARSASAFLARQFGGPSGLAGHVVTRLLARGNARFNRWLVNEISTALPVPHTMIELGYGPGIALQEILRRYPAARVTGIDPSPVVRKSARRRNAAAIKAGRLALVTGDAGAAAAYGPADFIVACHVLYFWPDQVRELQRIREVLAPAGHMRSATSCARTCSRSRSAPSPGKASPSTTPTINSPPSWTGRLHPPRDPDLRCP